jgi:hypothetical protein
LIDNNNLQGNFSEFNMNELLEFQISYWNSMQFDIIYPNITPTSCINVLLLVWNCDDFLKEKLRNAAECVLKDFLMIRKSMLFAPNNVALCALITAFTMQGMDCTAYLQAIPEIFFVDIKTNNVSLNSSLNFEKCLEIFDNLRLLRMRNAGIQRNLMNNNSATMQSNTIDDENFLEKSDRRRYLEDEDEDEDEFSDEHVKGDGSWEC